VRGNGDWKTLQHDPNKKEADKASWQAPGWNELEGILNAISTDEIPPRALG
jgi:hypothetical protein